MTSRTRRTVLSCRSTKVKSTQPQSSIKIARRTAECHQEIGPRRQGGRLSPSKLISRIAKGIQYDDMKEQAVTVRTRSRSRSGRQCRTQTQTQTQRKLETARRKADQGNSTNKDEMASTEQELQTTRPFVRLRQTTAAIATKNAIFRASTAAWWICVDQRHGRDCGRHQDDGT